MPKRFLEPGLPTSDHWNACKWITQSFHTRLITLVDDFGRYDGRPAILRAHAFPLRPEVTERIVVELCEELTKNDLAIFYEKDRKVCLQLTRWKEKPRSEPKYPPFEEPCEQLYASARKCCPTSSSSSTSSTPSSSPAGEERGVLKLEAPDPEINLKEFAREIFDLYPRKDGKADALKAILASFSAIPPLQLRERVQAYAKAVSEWPGDQKQFVPWCQKWMNKKRWLDDPSTWVKVHTPKNNGQILWQIKAREKRMAETKRKHYSDVQSLIGGKHYPAGWRDTKAKDLYYFLKNEVEELRKQL